MIATLVSYGNALLTFSDMLNLAGHNWAVANYDADRNLNKGPQPAMPPPRVGQKMDAASVGIPDAQPAPYTTHDRGLTAQPAALADQTDDDDVGGSHGRLLCRRVRSTGPSPGRPGATMGLCPVR